MNKFLACGLVVAVYLHACQCKSIGQLFRNLSIVPLVIEQAPEETCRVSFPVYNVKAIPGGTIDANEAKKRAPKVRWNARSKRLYTMIMTSPDLNPKSSPEPYSEWDAWVVVNIPQRIMRKGNIVRPYFIPDQARRSGDIYYVFLIFEQPEFLFFIEEATYRTRQNFRTDWFVLKYNLTGPVAGNYFKMIWPKLTTSKYYKPGEIKRLRAIDPAYSHKWTYTTAKFKKYTTTTKDPYYYHSSEYIDTSEEDTKKKEGDKNQQKEAPDDKDEKTSAPDQDAAVNQEEIVDVEAQDETQEADGTNENSNTQ